MSDVAKEGYDGGTRLDFLVVEDSVFGLFLVLGGVGGRFLPLIGDHLEAVLVGHALG